MEFNSFNYQERIHHLSNFTQKLYLLGDQHFGTKQKNDQKCKIKWNRFGEKKKK